MVDIEFVSVNSTKLGSGYRQVTIRYICTEGVINKRLRDESITCEMSESRFLAEMRNLNNFKLKGFLEFEDGGIYKNSEV